MAFQNTSWLPKKKVAFEVHVNHLGESSMNSGSSPRKMRVPHAYEAVHASSDQQAVLLTKVKRLDAFVDAENCLVT